MAKDLEIIKRLEKKYGMKLFEIAIEDIENFLSDNIGYAVDENENIIGLRLNLLDISDISEIQYLTALRALDLSQNQISDISPVLKLKNLELLVLFDNRISHLPEELLNLGLEIEWEISENDNIFLEGNPLEIPPVEIVKQGNEAIRAYFESLKGEKQALNEVKVLLIGDGGAGKTSLMKRLLAEGFNENEPQTHGINIKSWKINVDETQIKVNFWDFGGQEIMHATHQFFLSKRSLYILVLDCRKDEKTEYWLKHIKSFGGDSPVLVVLNKIDENPNFDVNRPFLQDKYNNIKGFYRVSCAENTGVEEFSQDLKIALENVELIRTTWAKTWFNIKTQLENITDHYISYKQYKNLCEAEKILDSKSQETLVDFLNDLGVVLHFKEFELEDTHVLEPKWVTEAVYKIINSNELAESKGIINLRALDKILKKKTKDDYSYPRDKYRYIITLMKKFELCYGIDDETVLIPDLLAVQEPPFDFDYAGSLKFIIEYDFLPHSVMPRFIVKMHKDIKGSLRWRTGVVLEDKAFQTTAVSKADHDDKKIYIYFHGQQKRDYFSVIRYAFSSINHSFEKIGAKEMVPCTCQECSNNKNPHFYNYATLVKFRQKGRKNIPCSLSAEDVAIDKLLDGIERTLADKEEEILQILRKLKEDSDNRETLLKKANEIISLQPNIMGIGINLNNLIKKLLPGKKK
jgi:internalin A